MNVSSSILRDALGGLRPAAPVSGGRLTVLPFTSTHEGRTRYVLLAKALERGRLRITEVGPAGHVPHLLAVNKGPWPVLIFDGEELVGAKQNRIANATILVGVGESILPVSCVEQGRWSRRSQAFASGRWASHPRLRKEKEAQVRSFLAESKRRSQRLGTDETLLSQPERAERYRSDQGAVWREVARGSGVLGVNSETHAMADAYELRLRDLESIEMSLAPETEGGGQADAAAVGMSDQVPVQGMVGAAVFVDGTFLCFDALWPAERFSQLYPKLLRGYSLEALFASEEPSRRRPADRRGDTRKAGDPEAVMLRLFAELAGAPLDESPGVDLGADLRAETPAVLASGLRWERELVQLSVFAR
jgi:hypothetical protein